MDIYIKLGRVSLAIREEVTKAGSQSCALFHIGGLSSNLVSTLELTHWLPPMVSELTLS